MSAVLHESSPTSRGGCQNGRSVTEPLQLPLHIRSQNIKELDSPLVDDAYGKIGDVFEEQFRTDDTGRVSAVRNADKETELLGRRGAGFSLLDVPEHLQAGAGSGRVTGLRTASSNAAEPALMRPLTLEAGLEQGVGMFSPRSFLQSFLLGTALACLPAPYVSGAEPEAGYVSLFNGKDLTGWQYTDAEKFDGKTGASDERYVAKDGVLVVQPQGAGPRLRQLWTSKQFPTNFTLKLEFRAAVNADSGIFLRKPQLQCRDYLVAGPYKELKHYKPQDWNEVVVVVRDNVAHCTCNGEVLEAALKLPETGPIGLEADRGQMEYRNIRIRPE
jgi:hypothetical protein